MTDIIDGIIAAFWLIVTFDADLWEISLQSLHVSLTALIIASGIAIPFGTFLAVQRFRYRRLVISVINALMGLPPVVVGLIVYILLSRSGPFGVLGLLFTPTAMIIAQVIIITPVIASIAHQAMRELWDFALALGLGFVLIGLALAVNIAIHWLSQTERGRRW